MINVAFISGALMKATNHQEEEEVEEGFQNLFEQLSVLCICSGGTSPTVLSLLERN